MRYDGDVSVSDPVAPTKKHAGGTETRVDPESAREQHEQAQKGFSRSVIISGVRCLITYIILPFVFPTALGAVGPAIGLIVGSIALVSNVFSIRRFWKANHAWRKPITVIHLGVIALLLFLMVRDIQQLIG